MDKLIDAILKPRDREGAAALWDNANSTQYEFNQYLYLRGPDDPVLASDVGETPESRDVLPSDPRFSRLAGAVARGISGFIDYVRVQLPVGTDNATLALNMQALLEQWWLATISVKGFNRLGRYSTKTIRENSTGNLTPELFYASALQGWLSSADSAKTAVSQWFTSDGDAKTVRPILKTGYWDHIHTELFRSYFTFPLNDPGSPRDEYPFELFDLDEVLFGLKVVSRQSWNFLEKTPSAGVLRTLTLGPGQQEKISSRKVVRKKYVNKSESISSFETSSESTSTHKDTSDVVEEATKKVNRKIGGEAGVNLFGIVKIGASGEVHEELGDLSKDAKTSLNESMQKAATRIKRDTKLEISVEGEDTFEANSSAEIMNKNDEFAVTYEYRRLQEKYWVTTELAHVNSVILVPEAVPAWDEIDIDWIRDHGEFVAWALLDESYAGVLAAIRSEPSGMQHIADSGVFQRAADAAITATGNYSTYTGGRFPDWLSSGQQYFERDYERRDARQMDEDRRVHQTSALVTHIRRNILHYMRAIWSGEDYDQKIQRLSRMRVTTRWTFMPFNSPPPATDPSPLEMPGVFIPDPTSVKPLTDVIDPIGPIGYLFNCAIFNLRNSPQLVNLHEALSYLRAAYARFDVQADISAGEAAVVDHVAFSPRNFRATYKLVYRQASRKWLLEIQGIPERDWPPVASYSDGSVDVSGIRVWLTGAPSDNATLTITVTVTSELEDPHFKLIKLRNPLPPKQREAEFFSAEVIHQMCGILPRLRDRIELGAQWNDLTGEAKGRLRAEYHHFLLLRDSGRLVTVDTGNPYLEIRASEGGAFEPFKTIHRYLDVRKEKEELTRRQLENDRRWALLGRGVLADPEVERVTVVTDGAPHQNPRVVNGTGATVGLDASGFAAIEDSDEAEP